MKPAVAIFALTTTFAAAASAQPQKPVPASQAPPAAGGQVPLTAPEDAALEKAVPDDRGVKRLAILRGLNKITGRAIDVLAPAGVSVPFGHLSITLRYCYTVPPEEPPETAAFLQIDDLGIGKATPKRAFSGWMFASTPALNGLEHPVYDVWVITCKTKAPETPPAGADGAEPPAATGGVPPGLPADVPPPSPGLPRP